MTFRSAILASMLLPATLSADVLVNLDATTLPAGPLPFWNNAGTVGGSFTSQLDVPIVSAIGGVQCVTFDGVNDWYVGPPAPASVTGTANAVSIEVWARNPALADEETLIAWGRRGGPDGTNRSFNYGANAVFGAVGHWGAPDVGWGGQNPAAAQWHYLVYTYNGASTQVYADGLLKNSKATALNTHSVSTSGVPLPFVLANQNNADGSRTQQNFVGSLSIARVRVRNEVLSPAQIASTYQAEGASFLPPVIQSFRASAPTYLPGQSITLTWDTDFTDTVSIDNGIGTVNSTDGSIAIAPPAFPTTYTITAQSPRGTTTAQVTVAPFAAAELANRWSFNEASGNTLIDSVTGQNATIVDQTGGTPWSRLGGRVVLPGGVSGTAPYIDLPNFILSTKNEVTFEGWATINGSQNWSRLFDFGTGTAGELFAPGGTATGTEYLLLSAQTGANQAVKRFEIRDNGVSNLADVGDPATIGQEFHFAVVYDADGAAGQPQLRYYKNGTLLSTVNTSFRLQDILDVNNWLGRSNWTADANTNAAYNEFRVWNGALSAEALADTIAAGPDALPQMPRIEAFAVFPGTTIYRGDSVNLSYVVADPSGAGVTLSIDQGIGALPGNSGFVTVAPTSSKTYTLSATSPAGTRTAPVTVTVLPSEPTAENVSVATPFQTAISVTLVASDPNTPAGALTYTIITPPASGTLSGNGSTRSYTPNAGFTGPDSFTYRANDGTSDSNLATVTILVDAPPTNPTNVLLSQADIKTSDTTGSFIARLQATDANAQDTHTFTLVSGAGDTHNAFFSIVNGQLIAQHDFAADLGQTISARIRVTDNTGRSFEKIITLPVVAPTRGIVINELHYNPPNNSVPVEYIELYNPLTTSVNLGGWRFTDGVDYTFPPNTSIAAGGYLVVSRDPAAMQAVYGVTALGPWIGALSSDGERVTLRDHLGVKVDEVDYDTDFPWPVPPNGDGPSMELIHPTLDNDLGSSWRASSNAAATVSYVTAGSTGWRWRGASSEASTPVTAWRLNGFAEDGTWATGTAPFGSSAQALGIPAPATILPGYGSTYRGAFLRKTFTASGTLPKALLLRVYHNDGAIVWLNGQEIARVAVSTSLANPPFNNTQLYDNFAGWSEILVTGADTKLLQGANVLAVQAWGKTPSFRENDTVDDFIIDAELRNSPDLAGTPGAQNSAFALNAAPNIRNVTTSPTVPDANDPAMVTARVTDPQGVGSVTLQYQVCPPGGYIPAKLPRTVSAILADPFQPRAVNPAFENAANWTSIPMVDDGSGNDAIAGDGVFTGTIPAQINRTLVRYRITVTDLAGSSIRTPYANDPSLNFAYFVYNGVPNYIASAASVHPDGAGHIYPAAMLTTMPVYHWIMRAADVTQLMAWNGSDQFPNDDNPRTLEARRYYNHEGALVYDGKVYDHVDTRLRGGNSRYNYQGKRHLKFKFQQGSYFQARDQAGKEYPTKWQTMLTNKLFGNIGPADWGITQKIGEQIFNLSGSPMPYSHWFHFRVIDDAAEQSDQYNGDFWGLSQAIEDWDSRFLEAHDLPKGNLYKLTDFLQDGESVGRYLAEDSVQTGEDFDNYRYGVHPAQTESWLNTYVDLPQWFRYNAAAEAVRHYDVFPEPTGRHRLKNWIWYFRPDAANPLGKLVTMPYDLDATFGPTWNSGWDGVHNALYNRATFNDSPTISGAWLPKPNLQIQHRNAVRHLRDLLWQPDQLNTMIDRSLATIEAFSFADRDRWVNGPVAAGTLPANIYWSAAQKAQDMKNFAFTGGNWAQYGGSQPADANAGDNGISGLQGRDAYLDYFADQTGDAPLLPSRPTITYTGTANYPVDGLSFTSSAFADPQGAPTFGAMQWRVGEITDATAPAYDPGAEKVYEIADVWVSAELTAFNASVAIPGTALQAGHTYRARVRHKDDTGRWSHWSLPSQFTTTASNYTQVLKDNLMITEFLYQPTAPTAAESAHVEGDFEYIELTNISPSLTLNLANVRFTKGIDFDFAGSAITSLAPGARVVVVKKTAAFQLRYGSGRPIAGEWDPADNLSNQGEEVKLSFGAGAPIHDFNYLPTAPWPEQPGTGGVSLVLRNPSSRPDHNIAANWRASYVTGGTPGLADRVAYADWAAPYGGLVELSDRDKDGWVNLLEYAFGGNPDNALSKPSVTVGAQVFNVNAVAGNYLTLTFTRNAIAEDLTMAPEFCSDLSSWTANGVLTSSVPLGDGTVIETWRSPTPISANARAFGRVRVIKQ